MLRVKEYALVYINIYKLTFSLGKPQSAKHWYTNFSDFPDANVLAILKKKVNVITKRLGDKK